MIVIYGLRCPVANTIRYIGKTKGALSRRLCDHIRASRLERHYRASWIRSLIAKGLRPSIEVLVEVPASADWQAEERRVIAEYLTAGFPLTNQTSGGDGWQDMAPEALERMRETQRRRASEPGQRERLSMQGRGAWASLTPEQFQAECDKRARTQRAAFANPEIRAERLAKMHSPEARAKRAAARAASMEATREKLRAAWARRKAKAGKESSCNV